MNNSDKEESWEEFIESMEQSMFSDYSDIVLDYMNNPRNKGALENATHHTSYTGPCGDTIEIWAVIRQDIIEEISYNSYGCGVTEAVGSMITEMAKGKKAADALKIQPEQIIEALRGLPKENEHCALLAKDAIHKALKDGEA